MLQCSDATNIEIFGYQSILKTFHIFWKPNKYEWLFHSDAVHFLPQIRIFRIKYIEKLEGVSVGGSVGGSAGAVSLVTICIKFTGWWVHYSHYGAAATRRTHVTVVTSGDTWHVTRDVITRETRSQSPYKYDHWLCCTVRTWILRIWDLCHVSQPH